MTPLVNEYVTLAKQWGVAMDDGDSSVANAIHDRVQDIHKQIVEAGQEDDLFGHATDTSDSVSFFVASHLKQREPARAVVVYERLVGSALPFVAVSSRYILKEMKKAGN